MTMELSNQPDDLSSVLRPGKDEMNFAEFPIALTTDRVPKGQKSIKFEDQIYDPKRKKMVTRRRIIEGSEEYGLPTATDDAVILALIQLTKQKSDFSKREVEFTRLELIRLLGWADEGRNFERLKLSLIRIANVTYNYENAWWDNRQKTWVTKVFHIIDTVEINDSRVSGRQRSLFPSKIMWNDVVFDSFQASFLRDIDFQLCIRLEHPIALRMYRFLGKRFHVQPEWSFNLKEFAHDHMGLGQNYEGGTQIARKLKPAVEELEKVGFLEPLPASERFHKKGREWTVKFVQRVPAAIVGSEPVTDSYLQTEPLPSVSLATQLVNRGVTPKTAAELIATKPAEIILARLEVFDWLIEQKDAGIDKSPSGFLVSSIRDEYAPPKGFEPLSERNRRKEVKLLKERETAEKQRLKANEAARKRSEHEAIIAYRKTLSAEQFAELEVRAIAQADPAMRESLLATTEPAMRRLLTSSITDQHIRQVLNLHLETA